MKTLQERQHLNRSGWKQNPSELDTRQPFPAHGSHDGGRFRSFPAERLYLRQTDNTERGTQRKAPPSPCTPLTQRHPESSLHALECASTDHALLQSGSFLYHLFSTQLVIFPPGYLFLTQAVYSLWSNQWQSWG